MKPKLLISSKEIQIAVKNTAEILSKEYGDKNPTIVAVLKGSICFLADLIRHLDFAFTVEFVQVQSYGMHGTTPQEAKMVHFPLSIKGKNVLLLDDIFDTGKTLSLVQKSLYKLEPLDIRTLVLLEKKKSEKRESAVDRSLFTIEDLFVVGYGLDFKEQYRGLPGIYTLT